MAVDPEGGAALRCFSEWCYRNHGGPYEAFRAIDQQRANSLKSHEFTEGLRTLGFFKESGTLQMLKSKDLLLKNLWPLLDTYAMGYILPEQLLFLEKDRKKKHRLRRELERMRDERVLEGGSPLEPVQHNASELLTKLVMQTTALGGKHWKQVQDGHVAVGNPRSRVKEEFSRPLRRVISLPSFSDGGLSWLQAEDVQDEKPRGMSTPSRKAAELSYPEQKFQTEYWEKASKESKERSEQRKLALIQGELDLQSRCAKPARNQPSTASHISEARLLRLKAYGKCLMPLPAPKEKQKQAKEHMQKSQSHVSLSRKVKPLTPVFDPMNPQDFLCAAKRDTLWQHYIADAAPSTPL